jgi:hypothetical protein
VAQPARDAADAVAAIDPVACLRALVNAQEDARVDDSLTRRLETARRERDARLDAMSTLGRANAEAMGKQLVLAENRAGSPAQRLPPVSDPERVRQEAEVAAGEEALGQEVGLDMAWVQTATAVFWPVLWVAWAFLFRGGFSFPVMGLALVRRDGRPAWRLQCAWRALCAWTPLVALATGSVWLDFAYWHAWPTGAASPRLLTASSVAWWACLVLLPVYAALALAFPTRSLHDRLSGTYLVPR